jgi:Flp pilus assembly protein TadD
MLVALGALLAVGRPRARIRAGVPGLVAVGALAVGAVIAVALPALARRDVDRALEAIDAGRLADAVDAADRARLLNPLSLGPLQARAIAADAAGDKAAAVAWYEKATALQPENPDAWYDLGLYQAIATGDQCAAYAALNHSYTLDPKSSRWVTGGPLDVARDAVNAGACER